MHIFKTSKSGRFLGCMVIIQYLQFSECFEKDSIKEDDNGTVTFKFSEMAKEFSIMFKNVTKCINKHTNTSLYDMLQEVSLLI